MRVFYGVHCMRTTGVFCCPSDSKATISGDYPEKKRRKEVSKRTRERGVIPRACATEIVGCPQETHGLDQYNVKAGELKSKICIHFFVCVFHLNSKLFISFLDVKTVYIKVGKTVCCVMNNSKKLSDRFCIWN